MNSLNIEWFGWCFNIFWCGLIILLALSIGNLMEYLVWEGHLSENADRLMEAFDNFRNAKITNSADLIEWFKRTNRSIDQFMLNALGPEEEGEDQLTTDHRKEIKGRGDAEGR